MKLRNGFVGNSSSSSFFIRELRPYTRSTCSGCGRDSTSLKEAYEILSDDCESSLRAMTIDDVMDVVECELEDTYEDGTDLVDMASIRRVLELRSFWKMTLPQSYDDEDLIEFNKLLKKLGVHHAEAIRFLDLPEVKECLFRED